MHIHEKTKLHKTELLNSSNKMSNEKALLESVNFDSLRSCRHSATFIDRPAKGDDLSLLQRQKLEDTRRKLKYYFVLGLSPKSSKPEKRNN